MPNRLTDIQLWKADRSGQISTPESLYNSLSAPPHFRDVIGLKSEVQLTLHAGCKIATASESERYRLSQGKILRFVYNDDQIKEYRIKQGAREFSGQSDRTVTAEPISQDLQSVTVRKTLANGHTRASVSFYKQIFSDIARKLLSAEYNCPDYFELGTVPASFDQDTYNLNLNAAYLIAGLKELCSNAGGEWKVSYNSTTDSYQVNFYEAGQLGGGKGEALNRLLGVGGGTGNRLKLERKDETDRYFSRIVPLMGQDNETQTMAGARWSVEMTPTLIIDSGNSTSLVTLRENAIVKDGYGLIEGETIYFGNETEGWYEVTDTFRPNRLYLRGDVTGLSHGYFKMGPDKEDIVFLEDAEALENIGPKEEKFARTDIGPYANLVEDSGISAALSDWNNGLPVGFAGITGNETITQEANDIYVKHGVLSAKVQANTDEGLETVEIDIEPEDLSPYFSLQTYLQVGSGSVRIEIEDSQGNIYPTDARAETNSQKTIGISIGGEEIPAGTATIKFIANEDNTVFYVDALSFTQSGSPQPYKPLMGPRALWMEAGRYLRRYGGDRPDIWTGEGMDMAFFGSEKEIEIGSWVTIREDYNEQTGQFDTEKVLRVIELQYDEHRLNGRFRKTVKLASARSDASRFFQEQFVTKDDLQSGVSVDQIPNKGLYDRDEQAYVQGKISEFNSAIDTLNNDSLPALQSELDNLNDNVIPGIQQNVGTLSTNLSDLDNILGNPSSAENFFRSIATNQFWTDEFVANKGYIDQLVANTGYFNSLMGQDAFFNKFVGNTFWGDTGNFNNLFADYVTSNQVITSELLVGRINAGDSTLQITGQHIEINGQTTFASGYDPSTKAEAADLNDYVQSTVYNQAISDLQGQIDGQIESYFQDHDPTPNNEPAVNWTTTALKEQHRNDTFTNSDSGESWRWVHDSTNGWHWSQIANTATQQALQKALQAQDTADGKRRVFVSQPTPPYDIGDLWSQGPNGELLKSTVVKVEGDNFNPNDWEKASKYTDDSRAIAAENNSKDGLAQQLGYTGYDELTDFAASKKAFVNGGYFNTELLQTGVIASNNDNLIFNLDTGQLAANTFSLDAVTSAGGIKIDSTGPFIDMYSGGATSEDRTLRMAPGIGITPVTASDLLFEDTYNTTTDWIISVNDGVTEEASSWSTSLTSTGRSSEYPVVITFDVQPQNFSNVDSYQTHSYSFELVGVKPDATEETIKTLKSVSITPFYTIGLTDTFTVGPIDAGVVKYDSVHLHVRGEVHGESFDIHISNVSLKQYQTKATINDKGYFLAVSPDIIRTMSDGAGGMLVDSGGSAGGGSAIWGGISGTLSDQTDLKNVLNSKLNLSGGTITGNLTANNAGFTAKQSNGTWFDAVSLDSNSEIFRGIDAGDNNIGVIAATGFDGLGGGYLDLQGKWRRDGSEIWHNGNLSNPIQTDDNARLSSLGLGGSASPNYELSIHGRAEFVGNNDLNGMQYHSVNDGTLSNRYFLMFDYTDGDSHPFLTNRAPSGDFVIKSGVSAGGGEIERIRVHGGDGDQRVHIHNAHLRVGALSKSGQSTFQAASSFDGDGYTETPWMYTNFIESDDERGSQSTGMSIGGGNTFTNADEIGFITNGQLNGKFTNDGLDLPSGGRLELFNDDNSYRVSMDSRGDGILHKNIKVPDSGSNYTPYAERWWDGDNYHEISVDGTGFRMDSLNVKTLKTELFKKEMIQAMGGRFVFNSSTTARSSSSEKDSTTVRLFPESPVLQNGDFVAVSGEDGSGFYNAYGEVSFVHNGGQSNEYYSVKYANGSSWSQWSRVRQGDTIVKLDGNPIAVDARENIAGRPFIEGYDGINSIPRIFGGAATPNWRIGKLNGFPDISGRSPSGVGLAATNAFLKGTIFADDGYLKDLDLDGTLNFTSNGYISLPGAGYINEEGVILDHDTQEYILGVPATMGWTNDFNINGSNAPEVQINGFHTGVFGTESNLILNSFDNGATIINKGVVRGKTRRQSHGASSDLTIDGDGNDSVIFLTLNNNPDIIEINDGQTTTKFGDGQLLFIVNEGTNSFHLKEITSSNRGTLQVGTASQRQEVIPGSTCILIFSEEVNKWFVHADHGS